MIYITKNKKSSDESLKIKTKPRKFFRWSGLTKNITMEQYSHIGEHKSVLRLLPKGRTFDEVRLRLAVYDFNGTDILVFPTPGYFASDAWIVSDSAYRDCSGSKFSAITGDDNNEYDLTRYKIRRIKDEHEFSKLMAKVCDEFHELVMSWFTHNIN